MAVTGTKTGKLGVCEDKWEGRRESKGSGVQAGGLTRQVPSAHLCVTYACPSGGDLSQPRVPLLLSNDGTSYPGVTKPGALP